MVAVAEDLTQARILDAGFLAAERYGLGRMTMTDVAREARLSRQTVYRYFSSKHDLLFALVLREEERIIVAVKRAIAPHDELRPALEVAFLTGLRALREHPLLDKVMATEPTELLPFLTVEANPVLTLGRRLMDEVFATRSRGVPQRLIDRAAETCARLFISYAITPPADDPETVARSLAELLTAGLTHRRNR